jgi:hypothetical protein
MGLRVVVGHITIITATTTYAERARKRRCSDAFACRACRNGGLDELYRVDDFFYHYRGHRSLDAYQAQP